MNETSLAALEPLFFFDNMYINAVIVLIVFYLLSKLFVFIAQRIFRKLVAKTKTDIDDKILDVSHEPLSLMILLMGVKVVLAQVFSKFSWYTYADNGVDSLLLLILIRLFIKVIDIVALSWGVLLAKKTKSHLDDQLFRLAHQISTVILYSLGLIWVLSIWGIEVGPFIAGLGIGGLAIAFALQPLLANVFGGVSLILDKTIKVGDIVKLESGESGKVHDVGLRSTRIRTWNNEIVIVPNAKLVDSPVTNFSQPDKKVRIEITFGVEYGSDIEKVKKLVLATLEKKEHVIFDPAPAIWFTSMGDSALDFKLMFWVDDIANKWSMHQLVITDIYNTLNKHKIGIPFPQQEVWMHNVK